MFEWIQYLADWLIYDFFRVGAETQLGKALNFFIYDILKILILLFIIVFLMGIVNSYFPIEKVRNFLIKKKLYGLEYLFASIFGAITPFCSCSSVPLFIGFVQGGIPLGITFSFLITSPLVNEIAIAMFLGLFGFQATLIYTLSGIALGVIGGLILSKMRLEPLLSEWTKQILEHKKLQSLTIEKDNRSFGVRLPEILHNVWDIIRGIIIYIIIGIGIGAVMHGYVPENFFAQYLGNEQWWTVPFATILAVPMYANAAAIIPVIEVFVAKGVPLGTAIAFMMATVGLSIPEATMLKKVMSWKLIGIFFSTVAICIIISGYIFNFIL